MHTTTLEWYMARLVSYKWALDSAFYNEIGLCAQNSIMSFDSEHS